MGIPMVCCLLYLIPVDCSCFAHCCSCSFSEKNSSDTSPDCSRRKKHGVSSGKDGGSSLYGKPWPSSGIHSTLKEEISLLERRLLDQFKVRHALEKALGYRTCSGDNSSDNPSMPKPANELIKEIASLELEVAYLEQYLLTLYRKAFDHQVSAVSPQSAKHFSIMDKNPFHPADSSRRRLHEVLTPDASTAMKRDGSSMRPPCMLASGLGVEGKSLDSGVERCRSSLAQCSAPLMAGHSPPEDSSLKAVRACHSQPLSMLEYSQKATSVVSLAEYLGTNLYELIPETPNKLSEDMVRCMSAIYCKLADTSPGEPVSSSPVSSSSNCEFSPCDLPDPCIPRKSSSFEAHLDNGFSGPYSTMIEVPWIYRDSQKLADIEPLLQNYRSFIIKLEEVDLRQLKHEEKLAFWINIHNALVMHSFLAYGIPQNNVRRTLQQLKAAYNVGGHTISADTIQGTILGCQMSRPGQWIRLILSPRKKFKAGDKRRAYVAEQPEPLLRFALCYGSHSDPALRVYTPENLSILLDTAKDEYLQASFQVRKDKKILLPKVVESYAKDSRMSSADVVELARECLPHNVWPGLVSNKSIAWMPYDFNFRYLISKDLSK